MMYKNTYLFADIPVEIICIHEYLVRQCRDYITDKTPVISMEMTESDIRQEQARSEEKGFSEGYFESLALYRKLCNRLARENIILFHSCAVSMDGRAYLFAAPSGTGKSTHASLWQKAFGERVHIINGDKPLIKVSSEHITVYGTPWNGKEHWGENTSAIIAGICFLSRGEQNKVKPISGNDAMPLLYRQVYKTSSAEELSHIMKSLTEIAQRIPLWQLECNISLEAAELSYSTMSKGKKDEV